MPKNNRKQDILTFAIKFQEKKYFFSRIKKKSQFFVTLLVFCWSAGILLVFQLFFCWCCCYSIPAEMEPLLINGLQAGSYSVNSVLSFWYLFAAGVWSVFNLKNRRLVLFKCRAFGKGGRKCLEITRKCSKNDGKLTKN